MPPSDAEIELEAKLNAAKSQKLQNNQLSPLASQFEGGLGGSPVSQLKQDQLIAVSHLKQHLKDTDGCLLKVIESKINSSDTLFSQKLEKPLLSLHQLLTDILSSQSEIEEITRQADVEYGQVYGERPYFQKSGQSAHPEDPYTHEDIENSLKFLLKSL